jgi:DNA-directed RNA polymerase specialized sigma24 family protein
MGDRGAYCVIAGELATLLQGCRSEEPIAWESFTAWARSRARVVLRSFDRLNGADRDDVVADALKNLVPAIRRGEIRGTSDGEIDAYVCRTMRNRALNLLRGRGRSLAAGESREALWDDQDIVREAPSETPAQDAQAIMAQRLEMIERALMSWTAEDRYLFLAKLHGVSAQSIQEALRRPPFKQFTATATIDTRFHRLRKRLMKEIEE